MASSGEENSVSMSSMEENKEAENKENSKNKSSSSDSSSSESEKESEDVSRNSKSSPKDEVELPKVDAEKISQKDSNDRKRKPSLFKKKSKITVEENVDPEVWKRMKEKAHKHIQLHCDLKSFKVKNPKKVAKKTGEAHKTILADVKASFEPGTITAIMGSSGAGKTTLLNILAGRTSGLMEGSILLNGHLRDDAKQLSKLQAYVMQDDILMKTQTPKEVIQFSANLRISDETSTEDKKKLVDNLLEELNIVSCKDTQIGAPGVQRGISGGERKRVAIGVELVTNPSLLFLDEPTSGLDSFTAENVVSTLRDLSRAGRTVICTIHQPNSQIFHMFDNLMLLAKGRVVYQGSAKDAVNYFASVGYPIPEYTNPSDYFMSLIHIDQSSAHGAERVQELIKAWENSKQKVELEQKAKITEIPLDDKKKFRSYEQGFGTQLKELLKRNFSDFFRSPLKLRAGLGQNIFLGVLIGLIYLNLDKSQQSVQDRTGSLFFILTNQAMGSIVSLVNIFPSEKSLFFRERNNHMYSSGSYYIAKVFGDMPFQILYPFLFGTISYWMIGYQRDASHYFIYVGILILVTNVGAGVGLLLSTIAPDSSTAIALVPVTIIPFMLFSGFLVNSGNVPVYFIWVQYISFVKWSFEALALNEFTGLTLTCNEDEMIGGQCRIPNGEAVIKSFSFDEESSIWLSAVVLAGMVVFFRVLGGIVLHFKANSKAASEV